MADLHVAFDSLVGYLVGMALVETVVKPAVVRFTKSSLRAVDRDASVPDWVVPDFLYEELEKEQESEAPHAQCVT